MKWEFTKNCRYKLRIILLTYTLLTLIPAKCKSQVKITRGRQTIGRELPNLLISEKKSTRFVLQRGRGGKVRSPFFYDFPVSYQRRKTRFGGERLLSGPVFFYGGPLSWQNQQPHGKNKLTSRQNRKPHGKTENLTAKPKTSRQNQIP